jgi:hypothetical protein
MTEPLRAADLILLLLAAPAPEGSLRGITRLEKLLFLAEQETDLSKQVEDRFQFEPYNYGPYSKGVYDSVELLEQAELVTDERVYEGVPLDEIEGASASDRELEGVERRFALTTDGREVAAFLASQHPAVASALSGIKRRYGRIPLRQLIRYVYSHYPPYAEASLIRDSV